MTGEQLDHPYITRVKLTHGTALPVREHWEEVQEQAVVGNVPLGLECEEVISTLRLISLPLQLYAELRWRLPAPSQSLLNSYSHPLIG